MQSNNSCRNKVFDIATHRRLYIPRPIWLYANLFPLQISLVLTDVYSFHFSRSTGKRPIWCWTSSMNCQIKRTFEDIKNSRCYKLFFRKLKWFVVRSNHPMILYEIWEGNCAEFEINREQLILFRLRRISCAMSGYNLFIKITICMKHESWKQKRR